MTSEQGRTHPGCPACSCTSSAQSNIERLRRYVLDEGGAWTGKRAMEYLHSIGFNCTIQRARGCMAKVMELEPDRVVVKEGYRWIWEIR